MLKGLKEKKLGRLQPSQQSAELLNDVNSDQRGMKKLRIVNTYFLKAMYQPSEYTFLHMLFFIIIIIIHIYRRIQHSAPWDNAFIHSVSTPYSLLLGENDPTRTFNTHMFPYQGLLALKRNHNNCWHHTDPFHLILKLKVEFEMLVFFLKLAYHHS